MGSGTNAILFRFSRLDRDFRHRPAAAVGDVPDQVVLMQVLHYNDDAVALLVVETREQLPVIVGFDLVAVGLGVDVLGSVGVIDDDKIGTMAGDGGAEPRW